MSEFQEGQERPEMHKKHRGFFPYLGAGIVAAVVSVAIYAGFQFYYQRAANERSSQIAAALDNQLAADTKVDKPSADIGTSQLKKTSESFRMVAKKVGPAVVNIQSKKGGGKKGKHPMRGQPQPQPQSPDDEGEGQIGPGDPFYDFFEHFGMPSPFHGFPQPDQQPQVAMGSGIIIDKKGIVVTNNHVVEDSSEILLTLSGDKTEVKAKIIGTDPRSDLAVLKIEKSGDYPYAEWADSDQVDVGDWAIAIGNPFGLDHSLTVGVVSAKGRSNISEGSYGDFIQTDAAINPGNSGGPLCDVDGRVMGVNSAIYTRSGGYMGIGFAIPSNVAKDVVEKLIKEGKVVRGWLGVFIEPLAPELAQDLGIKDGVGIHEVIEDSPAAKAGIKAGDVILEVDGKGVKEPNQLQGQIAKYKPGQKVRLKTISYTDKKVQTVTVTIGTLPDETPGAKNGFNGPKEKSNEPDKLGIIVSKGKEGMVIDQIQPGSVADRVGLHPGDVILRINRKSVDSVATYKKLVGSNKRLYFEIKRQGRVQFYQFTLPE